MSATGEPAQAATKQDPSVAALRASPRPVVRLNRRMLAAGASVIGVLVLGGAMWSLQSRVRERNPATELFNVDRVARADSLEQLPKDYSKLQTPKPAVPVLGEPLPGDLGPGILHAERTAQGSAAATYNDAAQADRLARLRDAEEAARSSVFFKSNAGSPGKQVQAGAEAAPVPSVEHAPFDALRTSASTRQDDPTATQNRQDQKEAFVAKADDPSARNPGTLVKPSSPYAVMAGTVISAALVTGINSDLPGQIIANVTDSVYDTATGRYLLIPQGSRLIGRYDSQVAFGQRRVLLVWTRLIMPDTSSIALDRLPGIDAAGFAGLEDGVDWHWQRILAGAAMSTLLGVGAELAAPENRTDGSRIVIAARESAQDSVNQIGQEITKRNLSVQPTLTVRPGFAVRVMVSKDLILRPYQPLFFTRGALQ